MLIRAKVTRLNGQEGLKALVMSPTRELAEQIARVLLLLVQGLRLHCCLLSTAAVVAGTDFSKVFACPLLPHCRKTAITCHSVSPGQMHGSAARVLLSIAAVEAGKDFSKVFPILPESL